MTRSRYRPGAPPDYSHRFHAGNVGDVWKHCALVEVLERVRATPRVHYLESHAGEGRYALAPTGLILVRPPDGALGAPAAAATTIGPLCATRSGAWSYRVVSWSGRSTGSTSSRRAG